MLAKFRKGCGSNGQRRRNNASKTPAVRIAHALHVTTCIGRCPCFARFSLSRFLAASNAVWRMLFVTSREAGIDGNVRR